VLAGVRGEVFDHDGRRPGDRARAIGVDADGTERRLEHPRRVDRHAFEADKMRRPDEHRHVERPITEEPIGMRGDRARVDQAGVRRDDRGEIARHRSAGASGQRKMPVNRRRERRRRPRIPRAGDGSFPDVADHGDSLIPDP
jgi:hypothetical protein